MDGESTSSKRRPPPHRRRDKPQLSCNACRAKKLKCDRLQPCGNCTKRGHDATCVYPSGATSGGGLREQSGSPPNVHDRIRQLEDLVLALMQQDFPAEPLPVPLPTRPDVELSRPVQTSNDPNSPAPDDDPPLVPTDLGRLHVSNAGLSYVDSSHWAAVLDGIAELKLEVEGETAPIAKPVAELHPGFGLTRPLLLYSCPTATLEEILEALPPKPITDRLVAHYFDALDLASAVIHSQQFLKEYNEFWQDSSSVSVVWIGLLYGMLYIAAQYLVAESPTHARAALGTTSEPSSAIQHFQERTVQCLILGQYTKGGPYVVETLMHYATGEQASSRDASIGMWLLIGTLVQIAMRMGYHRDPRHFSGISPFAGEMRRRVWMMIIHLDLTAAAAVGMSRLIKTSQTDTLEPRNLFDADFEESATQLPPSRPDTEMSPIFYQVVKVRLSSVFGIISDLITDTRPCAYHDVMKIDVELRDRHAKIPECYKYRPTSQCLSDSPVLITQRMYLQILFHKAQITLHRRYLSPKRDQSRYEYSRRVTVEAAMQLLRYQQELDVETQPTGRLYSVKWRLTAFSNQDFFLPMSVICFHLQHNRGLIHPDELQVIKEVLERTRDIWYRKADTSREAESATKAIDVVLSGLSGETAHPLVSDTGASLLPMAPVEAMPYPAHQDFVVDFQMPFSFFNSMSDGPPMLPMDMDQTDLFTGDAGLFDPSYLEPSLINNIQPPSWPVQPE